MSYFGWFMTSRRIIQGDKMPVTPIGNTIFINQNMNVVANKQAEVQNRFDLQNLAAMALQEDASEEITQVRPTEETYKIDPEHEHEKKKNNERERVFEKDESETSNDESSEEIDDSDPNRRLDIKI